MHTTSPLPPVTKMCLLYTLLPLTHSGYGDSTSISTQCSSVLNVQGLRMPPENVTGKIMLGDTESDITVMEIGIP